MSLSVALNTARASLLSTATQISVSGSNIANANDASRTRKIAQTTTTAGGGSAVTITRAGSTTLLARLLGTQSGTATAKAIADGLDRLHQTVGDTGDNMSPAARAAALQTALTAYANDPSDNALAQSVVSAAQSLTTTLNSATATVTTVRNDADTAMAQSVDDLSDLLSQLEEVNQTVLARTRTGEDTTDALDRRDALLGKISEEIGITVVARADNDIAVYTDSGVTLFDKSARTVSFTASSALGPGVEGNAVLVDGVPVTGANATMPIHSGKLAGLAELRDTIAPTYQAQLDELARGLVEAFAESDQTSGGGPDLAGLFTWSGGPNLPATGTLSSGLAGTIAVNPAVIPASGGSLTRIRDGGINGASYAYNDSGAAGFSDRLAALIDGFSTTRSFDGAANIGAAATLTSFGTTSVAWLEEQRQTAVNTADYQATLLSETATAFSNTAGINLDEEYALQLQLEQSYQASSKLIAVVNSMFDSLMAMVA